MSSPKPPSPQPMSAAERRYFGEASALLEQGRFMLEKQGFEEDYLRDILYGEFGITPKYGGEAEISKAEQELAALQEELAGTRGRDAKEQINQKIASKQAELDDLRSGKRIIGFDRAPDELGQQREALLGQYYDRIDAALRGEGPVDPALQEELRRQELSLNELLRKELGPGYRTSTGGSEALSDFGRARAEAIYGSNLSDILNFGNLATQAEATDVARTGAFLSGVTDISGLPLRRISGFSSLGGQFGGLAQALTQNRNQAYQGQLAAYNSSSGGLGSILGPVLGLAGTLGGAYIGSR